jgi:hypothetical protein
LGGFGFRTVPNYPPQSEWLVFTAVLCLYLPITVIVIAVAPVADLWIRLLAIGVVQWFAGLAVEGVRRRLARARGVPFIGEWDYAQVYVRWCLAEPLWVEELRAVPLFVVAAIVGASVFHGAQFWELPLRSWLPWLAMIPLWAIVAITRRIQRQHWREHPPRLGWLYALLAVFLCFSYLNDHPSLASAATAVGLITPVVVARYWISRVT